MIFDVFREWAKRKSVPHFETIRPSLGRSAMGERRDCNEA